MYRLKTKQKPPESTKTITPEASLTIFSKQLEEQLLLGKIIFDSVSEGVFLTDSQTIVLMVNQAYSNITGFLADEVIGNKSVFFENDDPEKSILTEIKKTLRKENKWQGEVWNRRKNGEIFSKWLTVIPIRNEHKRITRYVGIFSDVTNSLIHNSNIRQHAYYDMLTGLPNRLLLQDRLTFMINHARRNSQNMAVLLLDLNRFKTINDTLGYIYGDMLLKEVSLRLKTCVRDVDVIFRLGDDEFAVILEEIAQQQDAAKVAKRILSELSLPFALSEHELYISVSIGISIFPLDGDCFEDLLKSSEAAMLRAKELGINNYQHYAPAMNSKAFEQLNLEHNLRKGLLQEEFVVYYQPILNLLTGEIVGSEALLRWHHPELGIIAPNQFIPLAEETGLILPLGEWVLKTACKQVREWNKKFAKDFLISVNLSSRQFQQQDLVSTIKNCLSETELEPQLLELEITESLGMKNPELTLHTLHELKEMGIRIAIDDFGTGYSSLSYLKRFPIDTLKIDRSFVNDIPSDLNDAAIVGAIIALAHSLNLTVVAEGVEKEEQAEFLRLHGCEKVQGYLYSPPVSAANYEIILSKLTTL